MQFFKIDSEYPMTKNEIIDILKQMKDMDIKISLHLKNGDSYSILIDQHDLARLIR